MTSTIEFFGEAATLTVHRPPGAREAVLMIEAMDNVASITLTGDELRKLAAVLSAQEDDSAEGSEPDLVLGVTR